MMFFWNKNSNKFKSHYSKIISLLEEGDKRTIDELLWQPSKHSVSYLPIVYDMVGKFKNPGTLDQKLKIHKTFNKGKYQLIIFEVPWLGSDPKYSPIILDKSNSKIVGIMLPFNELNGILSEREISEIGKLAIKWTGFILTKQFLI